MNVGLPSQPERRGCAGSSTEPASRPEQSHGPAVVASEREAEEEHTGEGARQDVDTEMNPTGRGEVDEMDMGRTGGTVPAATMTASKEAISVRLVRRSNDTT